MNRRKFLAAGTATAAGAAMPRSFAAVVPPRRPNVLLLLPDQWRAQSLGCFGNPDVKTPHLDRLAAEGALLANVFANSPVCGPGRAVVLTGTYASTNGMLANDLRLRRDVPSLASEFLHAGYRTGYIGKWHLDGGPRNPGFIPPGPRRHGFQFWAANECSHKPYGNVYFHNTPDPIVSTKYEPEMWTDEALNFLDAATPHQPFFLVVSTGAPHDPYIAPEPYMRMYDPAALTMRPNFHSVPGGTRQDIAGYYASITAVDDQVGRILARLEQKHLDHDTIVLFASDHGNMLGSQARTLKQKPWEESIHIPGILRYPARVRPGSRVESVLSHVDFAPTLLSLCGIAAPPAMQGADLSRALLGHPPAQPTDALLQIFGPAGNEEGGGWRGIRTATHLYARTRQAPWALYDLAADPFQLTNLIGLASSRALEQQLDRQLNARMAAIGDHWQHDWTTPIGNGLDRYQPFETVPEFFAWKQSHP